MDLKKKSPRADLILLCIFLPTNGENGEIFFQSVHTAQQARAN
jgi:hypothetical protein